MAVPPIIPTSFVPHPTMAGARRASPLGLMSIFAVLAYLFLALSLISASGVFAYGRILASQKTTKDAQLATAESSLNQATIEQFLRLRDRFTSSKSLLSNHIALSGLFDLLSGVTPNNVRFGSVSVAFDSQDQATLLANGTAKSFNTLAIASDDFSADARLRNAIFSNISIAPGGSVKFVLSATLDPKLIVYTGSSATAAVIPSVTTTQASSTPPTP